MNEDKAISVHHKNPEQWRSSLVERVIHDRKSLDETFMLELYRYQYEYNPVYRQYSELMRRTPDRVNSISQIPYLPIGFFKSKEIRTGSWIPFTRFVSSGTSTGVDSIHYVRDEKLYLSNARACWREFYKDVNHYCFIGLLPSYLEKGDSSLVRMVDYFIGESRYEESAFFLNKYEELSELLKTVREKSIPTILIGVTYALLDLADKFPQDLSNVIIIETGGMKGKREELRKEEVHLILKSAFNVKDIHSEYGMTECFSQAYSRLDGLFQPSRTMRISLTELNDPMEYVREESGARGRIQICDLANVDSCAFIATDDLGQWQEEGFKVLGRIAESDLRGCNLLVD